MLIEGERWDLGAVAGKSRMGSSNQEGTFFMVEVWFTESWNTKGQTYTQFFVGSKERASR